MTVERCNRGTTGTNDALFVAVLAQIEREPERWYQGWWSRPRECGTAYCFAGWTCELSDLTWTRDNLHVVVGTQREEIAFAACDLLGIPCTSDRDNPLNDALGLFASMNSLDDLYRISADYLNLDEQVLRDKVRAEVTA